MTVERKSKRDLMFWTINTTWAGSSRFVSRICVLSKEGESQIESTCECLFYTTNQLLLDTGNSWVTFVVCQKEIFFRFPPHRLFCCDDNSNKEQVNFCILKQFFLEVIREHGVQFQSKSSGSGNKPWNHARNGTRRPFWRDTWSLGI